MALPPPALLESRPLEPRLVKASHSAKEVAKVCNIEEIDMSYHGHSEKAFSHEDEGSKDRFSRYIGAMGIDSVRKQFQSSVLLVGLSLLGIEAAKNLVLSGLEKLSIIDEEAASPLEADCNFYLSDHSGKPRPRADAIPKLRHLNYYVRVEHLKPPADWAKLVPNYQVVIVAEWHPALPAIARACR